MQQSIQYLGIKCSTVILVLLVQQQQVLLFLQQLPLFFSCTSERNKRCSKPGPLTDKPLEKDLISETDKKTVAPIYDSDDGLVALSPTPKESVYLPTPLRVSSASRKGISPYATFRVPLEGSIKNAENIECCVPSAPVQYTGKVKISEMPDICSESTYPRIQENIQYSNERPEWIPLHNLYHAHRY